MRVVACVCSKVGSLECASLERESLEHVSLQHASLKHESLRTRVPRTRVRGTRVPAPSTGPSNTSPDISRPFPGEGRHYLSPASEITCWLKVFFAVFFFMQTPQIRNAVMKIYLSVTFQSSAAKKRREEEQGPLRRAGRRVLKAQWSASRVGKLARGGLHVAVVVVVVVWRPVGPKVVVVLWRPVGPKV